jgi:hypothetical protein
MMLLAAKISLHKSSEKNLAKLFIGETAKWPGHSDGGQQCQPRGRNEISRR